MIYQAMPFIANTSYKILNVSCCCTTKYLTKHEGIVRLVVQIESMVENDMKHNGQTIASLNLPHVGVVVVLLGLLLISSGTGAIL